MKGTTLQPANVDGRCVDGFIVPTYKGITMTTDRYRTSSISPPARGCLELVLQFPLPKGIHCSSSRLSSLVSGEIKISVEEKMGHAWLNPR